MDTSVVSVVSGSEGRSQVVCLEMVWTAMISRGEESVLQRALGWQAWATEIQDGAINTLKADSQDTVAITIKKYQYTLQLQPCHYSVQVLSSIPPTLVNL